MARRIQEDTKALMLYLNHRSLLDELTDEERGRLLLALMDYADTGVEPAFTGGMRIAFIVLREDVDRSSQRWEEECRRRSEAGKKSAAVRAAKKFAAEVSCEEDSTAAQTNAEPEEAEEAFLKTVEVCSEAAAPGSSVEGCSTTPTNQYKNQNKNQNKNQSQNQSQNQNQNQSENKISPPSQPPGGRERAFAAFWEAYPRKVGKQAARKAFFRVKVPPERLMEALERQRRQPQWQGDNGRFIPHPVTWLNQGRWEDEPLLPPADSGPDVPVIETL